MVTVKACFVPTVVFDGFIVYAFFFCITYIRYFDFRENFP